MLLLSACRENINSQTGAIQPLDVNYYKRLEGTIGGDAVVLHLHKQGSNVEGTYTIQGKAYNLTLDTLIADSLVLISFLPSNPNWDYINSERLRLKWNGNGFDGQWISKADQETLPVILKEKYNNGSYALQTYVFRDSVKAFDKHKNSPYARFYNHFLSSENDWLALELKKAMDSLGTGSWEDISKRQFSAYRTFYKEQISEMEDISSELFFLNYYSGKNTRVVFNERGYLVIEQYKEEYTGGAHGYYFSLMHNFDVQNKKKLKLSDLVRADNSLWKTLLENQIRIDRNIPSQSKISDHLFVDELFPSEQFYFNELGIGFAYAPYDIASYADGQITVLIPYAQIKQFLTPEFATRMNLN